MLTSKNLKAFHVLLFCLCIPPCLPTFLYSGDAANLRIAKTILITPEGGDYWNPILSPDGNKVAFQGRKGGLYLRSADGTGELITVVPEGKGIFKQVWSPDSRNLAFDIMVFKERKRRMELHVFDTVTKESRILREIGWPFELRSWTEEGIETQRKRPRPDRKGLEEVNLMFDVRQGDFKVARQPFTYDYQNREEKGTFVVIEDGLGGVLSRIPGYILPKMSPQKDRILAARSARTYVLNLSGEVLADLGRAVSEVWSEDGEMVIYQISQAGGWHGQVLVASEIYVINADGTGRNQLTNTPDVIEVRPHWSRNGLKATYYDDATGRIFVAELEYELIKPDGSQPNVKNP